MANFVNLLLSKPLKNMFSPIMIKKAKAHVSHYIRMLYWSRELDDLIVNCSEKVQKYFIELDNFLKDF